MNFRKPLLLTFAVTLGLLAATGVLAWTGPSAGCCTPNASAPLNVSSTGQVKVGGLELNTGLATNGLLVHGNVGIGTVSPDSIFEVAQPSNWPRIAMLRSGLGTWYMGASDTTNNFGISLNSSGQILTVSTSGYVGVGNTSPAVLMDLTGNNVAQGGQLRMAAADFDQITFFNSANMALTAANRLGDIYYDVTNHVLNIENQAGNKNIILGQGGGNVAIGTATPYFNAQLAVDSNGATKWAGIFNYYNGAPAGQYGIYAVGSTYAVYANGPVYGSAFYYTSDQRAKKNIEAIASSSALQKILALQPVTFNWIDQTRPTTTQIGFIAQQVEQVVPELVFTDPNTTMKAVDYARVTPLLVGAAQAQQTEIDTLKDTVASQSKDIEELKAEIAELRLAH